MFQLLAGNVRGEPSKVKFIFTDNRIIVKYSVFAVFRLRGFRQGLSWFLLFKVGV